MKYLKHFAVGFFLFSSVAQANLIDINQALETAILEMQNESSSHLDTDQDTHQQVKELDLQASHWFPATQQANSLANWIFQRAKLIQVARAQGVRKEKQVFLPKPKNDLMESWIHASILKIHSFNSQELAHSIWALAKLSVQPGDALSSQWLKRASLLLQTEPESFQSQDLSKSIWALGKLTIQPSPEFASLWMKRASRLIDSFSSLQIANSIWALAHLDILPTDEFISHWIKRISFLMRFQPESFSSQNLANSISALAKLGIQPNEEFFSLWLDLATQALDSFNHQDLSNSFLAVAQLGIKLTANDPFISNWFKKSSDTIQSIGSPHALATSIRGIALFDLLPPSAFLSAWKDRAQKNFDAALLEKKKKRSKGGGFSNTDIRSLLQIHHLGWDIGLSPKLVESWTQIFGNPQDRIEVSPLAKSVGVALRRISKLWVHEAWSKNALSRVNFVNAQQKVLIEIDGPDHFLKDLEKTYHLRPQVRINESLILQDFPGYRIVRIPFYEWEALQDLSEQDAYLKGKIEAMTAGMNPIEIEFDGNR